MEATVCREHVPFGKRTHCGIGCSPSLVRGLQAHVPLKRCAAVQRRDAHVAYAARGEPVRERGANEARKTRVGLLPTFCPTVIGWNPIGI